MKTIRHNTDPTVGVQQLGKACKAFVEVNQRNGYEFESNEPDVYRLIVAAAGE